MARTKTTWSKGNGKGTASRLPTGKHAQKNPEPYIDPSEPDVQDYVQRYVNGESLRVIGQSVNLTPQQIQRRLIKWSLSGKADKSYADLVTDVLVSRIADADEMMFRASAMADISRAERFMRYSRMDFERRRPHLYGQRAEITFVGPAAVFLGLTGDNPLQLTAPTCIQIEQAAEQAEPDNVG